MILKILTSTHFKVFSLMVAVSIQQGTAATADEVADRVEIATKELRERMSFRNPTGVPPVASRSLGPYTDAELIRGIDVWMNRAKGKDLLLVLGYAGDLLINDPELIKDSSELRKLIATEKDPLRFFLLCQFSGYFFNRGETFIPEMSHMLFRHGKVDPPHQRFYEYGVGDVSKFTYKDIVGTLEYLHAPFDENTMIPDEYAAYPQRIQTLVKWLRLNWPGCEKLGEGEALMAEVGTETPKSKTPAERMEKRLPTDVHGGAKAESTVSSFLWPTAAAGIIVLAALVVWRTGKSKKRPDSI